MKPIWMPLYIADYLRDTMHLPREAHGSYLLLIMTYFTNQGPLPDDDDYLSNSARCGIREWSDTERKRLSKFFLIGGGVWRHTRCDREIEAAKNATEARKRASKLANDAKYAKRLPISSQSEPSRSPNGEQAVSQSAPQSQSQSQYDRESKADCGRAGEVEREIELPHGFPKTEAEAECAAAQVGCGAEFAAQTWNKSVARGGMDAKGVPIRSWPHYLRTEWTYQQARLAQQKGSSKNGDNPPESRKTVWSLTQSLNVVEEKLNAIKRRGHEDNWGFHLREEDKSEHQKFKAEQNRLKDLILKASQ